MNKNINNKSLVPEERIEQTILIIRNQKVILDSNLAALYGVDTRTLNQAVKRNINRFPSEFVFEINSEEAKILISQSVISSYAVRRHLPYAFTEHGALMAATILNSERAVAMSLAIIKTFVKLRQLLSVNKDLSHRLDELEEKYDVQFQVVFQEIKKLMELPEKPKKGKMGFFAS